MIPNKLKTFVLRVLTPRKYMESTFAPFYTENVGVMRNPGPARAQILRERRNLETNRPGCCRKLAHEHYSTRHTAISTG